MYSEMQSVQPSVSLLCGLYRTFQSVASRALTVTVAAVPQAFMMERVGRSCDLTRLVGEGSVVKCMHLLHKANLLDRQLTLS